MRVRRLDSASAEFAAELNALLAYEPAHDAQAHRPAAIRGDPDLHAAALCAV